MKGDKRVANALLVLFCVFSLVLLSLPLSGKVRAFRASVAYLFDPIPVTADRSIGRLEGLPGDLVRLLRADSENRRLIEENRLALLHKAEAESLRRENERLRGVGGLGPPAEMKPVCWARIMARDPLHWHRAFIVDAGREEGVELNSPVLGVVGSTLGVVGRVTEVGARASKVLLLSDELSAVAAYLPANQWEGLVQGQGTARLKLNYLPVDGQFNLGDAVYTSPTSATFPADLLVGTVSRVFDRDSFLAFQSVEVAPAVRAGLLKEVLILAPRRKVAS